jgi:hypothetical protein
MVEFERHEFGKSFERFERAAAIGHEESIWITSMMKGVDMEENALKEAFAKSEEPLGWYFAGYLSVGRERFDFFKKSAEGGCNWGQVEYAYFFLQGKFVEKDGKAHLEWLEKAANQNNPLAMYWLGVWFQDQVWNTKEKAISYYRASADLGWRSSMHHLAKMLRDGEGCEKDLRQAVIWSARSCIVNDFWELLGLVKLEFEKESEDSNQLCYAVGWGLYWYQYGTRHWNEEIDSDSDSDSDSESEIDEEMRFRNQYLKIFGTQCLDFYCSCVELQQKSIFTFLLCWNRTTGIKGPGQMIAQMVWEQREDNLVKTMESSSEQEPELKRIN